MNRAARWTDVALALALAGNLARAQTTILASVSSTGAQSNSGSSKSSVSADGRFVAFTSTATNLVAGDTNAVDDVFVRDRQAGTTERVSVATGGAQGNSFSMEPMLSADGNWVVFFSSASNLVPNDTNSAFDVFVRDRLSGTTERVSVDSGGAQANGYSYAASISADGRFVTFHGDASNLDAGDTNGFFDVFVRDRMTGTTERVSVDSAGAEANSGSYQSSISDDGRFVAFYSDATNLVVNDTNSSPDIFVRDRLTGTTGLVSVGTGGTSGNAWSQYPALSADGRFVAFESYASDLVAGDTNGSSDVFVRDVQGGATERVSVDCNGTEGDLSSRFSSISADGRRVAFESGASNLVAGDTNDHDDIFVRDRQDGTVELLSVSTSGAQANADSSRPAISAGGRFVTFESWASNLVGSDTNGIDDMFLRDRGAPPFTAYCFGDGTGPGCPCGNHGSAGQGCANSAFAGGALLAGAGTASVAADTSVLTASSVTGSVAVFFQGATETPATIVDDGLGCVGGPIVRLGSNTIVSNATSFPEPGDPSISLRGLIPAGGATRYYQAFYRNVAGLFCPPATSNRTNGIVVVWSP